MKTKRICVQLIALVTILVVSILGAGCQDKAGADFIYEASSSGAAVGAYGGFKAAFPDAQSVQWSNFQERIWQARFTQSSVEKAAFIQPNGVILDHGVLAAQPSLPKAAQDHLASQYAGMRVQVVLTGPNGGDNSPFRVIVANTAGSRVWRVLFSTDGQLLKSEEL